MSLRRASVWAARGVTACAVLLLGLVIVTTRPGDPGLFPPKGRTGIDLLLVSNGYHSGLVVPREPLVAAAQMDGRSALASIALRFSAYPRLEFGWGEERFYREVPTIDALNWRLALSALFGRDNASVVHVVGVEGDPRTFFYGADMMSIRVSPEGFRRLLAELDTTFAADPGGHPVIELGRGLYGRSLFYRARGTFSLLRVCNRWVADLLDAAGVPTSPLLATIPAGLIWDLRLRSKLSLLPATAISP